MKKYRVTNKCPKNHLAWAESIAMGNFDSAFERDVTLAAGWVEEVHEPDLSIDAFEKHIDQADCVSFDYATRFAMRRYADWCLKQLGPRWTEDEIRQAWAMIKQEGGSGKDVHVNEFIERLKNESETTD